MSTSGTPSGTSMSPVPCDTQIASAVLKGNKVYIEEHTSETHGSTSMTVASMPRQLQVISCTLFKDKVYVTGIGTKGDAVSHVYSLGMGRWSTLPEAPNYNAAAAIINGYFTLIGGRLTKDGTITNIVCSWIEDKFVWVQILAMPTARLESGVCHHDNLLLVTGGVVDDKKRKAVNTVDVYNFSTNDWSTRALELPRALRFHQLVVFAGNIYLAAGATTHPAPPDWDMRQFNHEAWRARWSDVKAAVAQPSKLKSVWIPITAPPVLHSTVVSCEKSLFLVGGVNFVDHPKKAIYEFVDGEIVDEKVDNSWKQVGNMGVGRYGHGVVLLGSYGTALFVAGGYVMDYPAGDECAEKTSLVEVVFL